MYKKQGLWIKDIFLLLECIISVVSVAGNKYLHTNSTQSTFDPFLRLSNTDKLLQVAVTDTSLLICRETLVFYHCLSVSNCPTRYNGEYWQNYWTSFDYYVNKIKYTAWNTLLSGIMKPISMFVS